MVAALVTVQQCKDEQILVLVDACVIIEAIRNRDGAIHASLLKIDRPLLRYTTTTLYEVAFADKGRAKSTLQDNQEWITQHFPAERYGLDDATGDELDRMLDRYADGVRGKADLGDALIAATFFARSCERRRLAIATINGQDFRGVPVTLVKDFLPPDFAIETSGRRS